jgi:hypothetical protein
MQPSTPRAGPASETRRRRRAEMWASMRAVEQALAAGGPEDIWVERVRVALVDLTADFQEHVDIAESPDGMSNSVLTAAPRLSKAAGHLAGERVELIRLIDDLLLSVSGPEAAVGADHIRERGAALLERLGRHRQRGSDLFHEAEQADIGGES